MYLLYKYFVADIYKAQVLKPLFYLNYIFLYWNHENPHEMATFVFKILLDIIFQYYIYMLICKCIVEINYIVQ